MTTRRTLPSWLLVLVCSGGLFAALGGVSPAAIEVPGEVQQAEQARVAAIEKASRSAVCVFGVGDPGGGGSAVVITPDGFALTNFHVASPVGAHLQCGMNDGQLYDAVIVGLDPTGDVALIKLLGRDDFPAAELGDSDQLRVGDWCFAVGNPFLLATDFHPSVSYGIVSGVHRYQYPAGTLLEYTDCIQTDAAINPGNSGGPLFNARGELVGINGRGSFEKRGRVNVGVGYAISINQVKNFLGYLHSGRIVDHATLGASVSTDEEGGVMVTNILDSSDAYRRGLRYGDQVVAFGGRSITTANSLKSVLGIFPKGWRLPLTYLRDGQRHDILVRLAGVHSPEELIQKTQAQQARPQGPRRPREPRQPGDRRGRREPEQPNDEQPNDEQPKDEQPQGDDPNRPGDEPDSDRDADEPAGARPMPPQIAALYEQRVGYANYYFNRLHRDRIWQACRSQLGDFSHLPQTWVLEGELDQLPGAARITLGPQAVKAMFGTREVQLNSDSPPDEALGPANSGGLLLALRQWQRLLQLGPEKFGDVYYLGTAPLAGSGPMVDVLVATNDVIETRFFFDVERGSLVGLEMYPDVEVDPCEIYFREYQTIGGQQVPRIAEIVHGDERFATLRIDALSAEDLPSLDSAD